MELLVIQLSPPSHHSNEELRPINRLTCRTKRGDPGWNCRIRSDSTWMSGSLCLTKHYSMKTYGGSGRIDPRSLDLGTSWE
jgi:hypothetical protein